MLVLLCVLVNRSHDFRCLVSYICKMDVYFAKYLEANWKCVSIYISFHEGWSSFEYPAWPRWTSDKFFSHLSVYIFLQTGAVCAITVIIICNILSCRTDRDLYSEGPGCDSIHSETFLFLGPPIYRDFTIALRHITFLRLLWKFAAL